MVTMGDRFLFAAVMIVMMALVSCSPLSRAQEEPQLTFEVAMQVDAQQEFHASLGVCNAGQGTFPGDKSFNGQMEVRHVPSGELKASAHVVPLRALEPGDTAWSASWRGALEAGRYELTWGAEGYGATRETFSIVEEDGRLTFRGEILAPPEPEPSATGDRDALVVPEESRDAGQDPTDGTPVAVQSGTIPEPDLSADWQTFEDETYGFRFKAPQDWTFKEMPTDGPSTPADWSLERSVIFFPQTWAERFERTSGPPDPDAPPAVPAISLEVYVGSMDQFRRAHPEPTTEEALDVNGIEAVREVEVVSDEVQLVRYVFQDPGDETVRVVLNDNYGGFAKRRVDEPVVTGLIPGVVETFRFGD